jgi:hypothetical protein
VPAAPPPAAARLWAGLDKPWREAFGQAWEALRSRNIAVERLAAMEVNEALSYLWPRLQELTEEMS